MKEFLEKKKKEYINNEKGMKDEIYYTSGRCQLYALVAAELLETRVSVLWDIDAIDDDLNPIGFDCLVHAFVKKENQIYDIEGLFDEDDYNLENYPCNVALYKDYNIDEFKNLIKKNNWSNFDDHEYDALKIYIKKDLSKYGLNIKNEIKKNSHKNK